MNKSLTNINKLNMTEKSKIGCGIKNLMVLNPTITKIPVSIKTSENE